MHSILVVDDHSEAQRRMQGVLGDVFPAARISTASSLKAARAEIEARLFELVILDLSLPDGRGETLLEPLRARNPDCQVVVWSMHDQTSRLIEALASGANGYLLKDQNVDELRTALERLPFGAPPLSASVARRVIEYIQATKGDGGERAGVAGTGGLSPDRRPALETALNALTDREKEILRLLAKGFNRPDIAGILNISKSTVATHAANIYAKLNVTSRVEAVDIARQLGLL
ncbi:MAG: response regulator transcription factor [Pseudomonadota bacterium]|nr:response regulator transcription factor [Pseudomonadota bacterium]